MVNKGISCALFMAPLLLSCQQGQLGPEIDLPVRPAFLSAAPDSAMAVMETMDMRQRVAQLMMVPVYSRPGEPESAAAVSLLVSELGVGGVIAMQGDTATTRRNLARLDSVARATSGVRLLTAMDAEWGAGMRLPDGVGFPKAMAQGAVQDVMLIRRAAKAAGQELRRLGIDIDFGPVVDVNSNPANPVIGNRSFGSDPRGVGLRGTAWAEGLREAGVMAVAKHFPGHGDADLDSHLALPVILSDSATLADVELPPFRSLIRNGVDGVMTAHLNVPALDATTGLPTSLSPVVVNQWLRDSLGFEGLVFTDALTMAGAAEPVPPGTREILALQAGNDILLFPSDPALVLDSIMVALESGRLDSGVVNAACLKVLRAKKWAEEAARRPVAATDVSALQMEMRGSMITRMGRPALLETGHATALIIVGNRGEALEERLRRGLPDLEVIRLDKGPIDAADIARITGSLAPETDVMLAFLDESNRPDRAFGIPRGAQRLVEALAVAPVHLQVALFTSAYGLAALPHDQEMGWWLGYHEDEATQRAMAAAWLGEGPALGRLPVDAGPWTVGTGVPVRATRIPHANTGHTQHLTERLDSLCLAALALGATPGVRLMVVAGDSICYDGSHGTLGDALGTPVARHHVYDVASITKVAVSTVLTMISVERGMLDLDAPLGRLMRDLPGPRLDDTLAARTVRDLLSHRSGLPAWIPFYLDLMAHHDSTGEGLADQPAPNWIPLCGARCMAPNWQDTITARIRTTTPGAPGRYRYSDLGYYLLKDILEDRWSKPLDMLADSLIFAPLQLDHIGYRPLTWTPRDAVAPTERDTAFRKAWIRGEVHDPGAAMMGGVSGHAGLFSDAHDLAVIMETMRQGGAWNGVRLVQPETVAAFTCRAAPGEDNRRGTGWDKPGLEPDSGASGNAGSWSSFGHSGFTGTLAWTDPEGEWTAIFLSNRICPDGENRVLIEEDIRTKALWIIEEELGLRHRFDPPADHNEGSFSPR